MSAGTEESSTTPGPEAPEGATPTETESTEAGATPAKPEGAGGATPPPDSSGLERALQREREARRKAEQELKKLKPTPDAETLAARIAELEEAAQARERADLVARVVTETSLPPALADRLRGQTEAELRADAENLKAGLPAPADPQGQISQPVGGPQGPPSGSRSPEEWVKVLRTKH